MTGIVEFLTARLDEDEQVARAVAGWGTGVWETRPHSGPPVSVWSAGERPAVLQVSGTWVEPGAHIARHDPARVLAEVAAKRAILAAHRQVRFTDVALGLVDVEVCARCHGRLDYPDDWDEQRAEGWTYPLVQERFPCGTVRALMGPYVDHPHFHPAWSRS